MKVGSNRGRMKGLLRAKEEGNVVPNLKRTPHRIGVLSDKVSKSGPDHPWSRTQFQC